MSDETVQNGVKPAGAAPASATQEPRVNPPAGEKPAPTQEPVQNNVPYTRFKEVIHQKNEMASRLEELERRLQTHEAAIGARQKTEVAEKHIERLVAAGMERGTAELLVSTQNELAKEHVDRRVAPLEKNSVAHQIDAWTERFKETHKDYPELEPEMFKVFQALPEQTQLLVSSDPAGLELLYDHVKLQKVEAEKQQHYEQGKQEAYENKGLKQAMSPTPGASASTPQQFTADDLKKMPMADYSKLTKEQRRAIHESLVRGRK